MFRRVREQFLSAIERASPHPDSGGCRPHTPSFCEMRLLYMSLSFQRRPPAVRAHFAFRRLCFAGCGNGCSSVIGRAFSHPDSGGGRPHTPAFCEIRALHMALPFQRRPPAVELVLHSGIDASQGAGTIVHLLSEELSRTRIPGAAALIPLHPVRSGLSICPIRFSEGHLLS